MFNVDRIHFSTIHSTNSWVKENLDALPKEKITLVTADTQTAGRGRFKRQWLSPPHVNLYATFCSYSLPSIPFCHIPQVLALAIVELLEKQGISSGLKWPNDVLVQGKKIAGILCETVADFDGLYVITGVGLNVNISREWLNQIDRPTTSMLIESGIPFDLETILKELQNIFFPMLEELFISGFSSFLNLYRKKHIAQDELLIQDGQHYWTGTFYSLNEDGSLSIRLKDSSIKTFYAGEIVQQ